MSFQELNLFTFTADSFGNKNCYRPTDGIYYDEFLTLLDKFYNPIQESSSSNGTDEISKIDLSFPNPQNYSSFQEYNSTVAQWLEKAKKFSNGIICPKNLLSTYFLPQPPTIVKGKDSHNFRTFKPESWTLLPSNYLLMVNYLIKQANINPEEEFPDQIPHRPKIFMKHHISSQFQWNGQLIPSEPVPFLYDTFEDFDEAYQNWFQKVSQSISLKPTSPSGFSEILGLDCVREDDISYNNKDSTSEISINKSEFPSHFSEEKIKLKLSQLLQETSRQTKPQKDVSEPLLVIKGVPDPNELLIDFIHYGCHFPTLTSKVPCWPFESIKYIRAADYTTFESIFLGSKMKDPNFKLLFAIIQIFTEEFARVGFLYDYRPPQVLKDFLDSWVRYLSDIKHFRIFVKISSFETTFKIRCSIFLHALIRTDPSCTIFLSLIKSKDIDLMWDFIELVFASTSSVPIASPTAFRSLPFHRQFPDMVTFLQFSVLLDFFIKQKESFLIPIIFEQTHSAYKKFVKSFDIVNIWGNPTALRAALTIPSKAIRQRLFSIPNVVQYLISQESAILQSILHSGAASQLATVLCQASASDLSSAIERHSLNQEIKQISFFSSVFTLVDGTDFVDVSNVFSLFFTACNQSGHHYWEFAFQLARVLVSTYTYTALPEFFDAQASVAGTMICGTIYNLTSKSSSLAKYYTQSNGKFDQKSEDEIMLGLMLDSLMCFLQVPSLRSFIIGGQNKFTEAIVMVIPIYPEKAWNLMRFLLDYGSAHILSNQTFKKVAADLIRNGPPETLIPFINFCKDGLIYQKNDDVPIEICNLLFSSIGQLACKYQNRLNEYSGNQDAINVFEDFGKNIMKLSSSETEVFKKEFSKHIGINQDENQKKHNPNRK